MTKCRKSAKVRSMSWQDKRTMTPAQFRKALLDLGLTQAACARYLDLSARQVARMQKGEAKVPVPLALLLAYLIEDGERPESPP
jgi:transcriptional regulator with XRE-family HTH domain